MGGLGGIIGSSYLGDQLVKYDIERSAYVGRSGNIYPSDVIRSAAVNSYQLIHAPGKAAPPPKEDNSMSWGSYAASVYRKEFENELNRRSVLYDKLVGEHDRAADKKDSVKININRTGGKFMDAIKTYISKYNTVIFTIIFVALADHFLFKGALREKIRALVTGLLDKASDQVNTPAA